MLKIIESKTNEKIKNLIRLQSSKFQNEENLYFIEGINIVVEALQNNLVEELYVTQKTANIVEHIEKTYLINEQIAEKISDVNSNQQIFAVCRKNNQQIDYSKNILVLDNIQDPGNLGTLIRSAYAFGFENIICSKDTVNYLNTKVLRSAQGNHFKLNIIYDNLVEVFINLKSNKYNIYGTILHDDFISPSEITGNKIAIVLGNEGNGIDPKYKDYFDNNIKINTIESLESLNVAIAGSIIMNSIFNKGKNKMKKHLALINGNFIDNGKYVEILDPVTLEPFAQVSALNQNDVDLAFKAARSSQKDWENLKLVKRIEILSKFNDEMKKNKEKLAKTMSQEIAKSLKDSLVEVERTIELIEYIFEEAKRIYPQAQTGEGMGAINKYGIFERIAKGVILAIAPFNYPINLAIAKIIPALVMGNTVVFKPATAGSVLGTMLGELAIAANFPAGIFNVVTGRGSEIGDIITSHEEIDMISFTGSANVGKRIKTQAKTSDFVFELGGKDPAIVLDDLDLEKYANEIIAGAYGYSGQRCTAIKRVLTTNQIADKLTPLLYEKVSKLKVGLPNDNADITHVIDNSSADFIQSLIDDAKQKGAKILLEIKEKKNLMWPTLIDNVTVDMKIAWEEPFGPVLPILRIDNIDEILKVANQSEYGLQASIFCQNISQSLKVAKQIETGTVNINSKSQRGPDSFPFLGIKNSGEGVQGVRESILSMTRLRGIVINY